jgi:hypothetical protein
VNARPDEGEELLLLGPWREAYARFYGRAPALEGENGAHRAFTFHRETDPFRLFDRMVGTTGPFAPKPALLERVRSLGYAWEHDGLLLTSPLPASFRRRMSELDLDTFGFSPRVVCVDALGIPAGTWLSHLLEGTMPIHAGTSALYERAHPESRRSERRSKAIIHHLLSVHHDMTKHVLCCHSIPKRRLLELGEMAKGALGRVQLTVARRPKVARWLDGMPKDWFAPVPLLSFYENDLVDYCYRLWRVIERPEDFAGAFERPSHYAQLVDVLRRRMEQAKTARLFGFSEPPRPYVRFEIDGEALAREQASRARSSS